MADTTFDIVEHDGGFAYRIGDSLSETYPSRDDARAAAAEAEKRRQGAPAGTSGQAEGDARQWHDEMASGDDRPGPDIIKDAAHRY